MDAVEHRCSGSGPNVMEGDFWVCFIQYELLCAKCDYCTWGAEKISLLALGNPEQRMGNHEED